MTQSASPSPFRRNPKRSEERSRSLDTNSLGLSSETSPDVEQSEGWLVLQIADDNNLLLKVNQLLADGYAGVIFTGPPGTSKSWYASQIAAKLVELDPDRLRFIQFHPSYQYEDFVEGYVPSLDAGGFELRDKHLLEMCKVARELPGKTCVLVIDELSRSDPGRVFGEALTYIEMTRRDQFFRLASGRIASIPSNLIFLATMNPMDRTVDEVDAALERRFAKIAMEPSPDILGQFLSSNGMEDGLRKGVLQFFRYLLNHSNAYCRVGHAYFYNVSDQEGLHRLWEHQLRFHMERAFRLDTDGFHEVEAKWKRIFLSSADSSQDNPNR
jgi:5-methylcytosine-specific restriction enzyme B